MNLLAAPLEVSQARRPMNTKYDHSKYSGQRINDYLVVDLKPLEPQFL